jgi:hypothetical protein
MSSTLQNLGICGGGDDEQARGQQGGMAGLCIMLMRVAVDLCPFCMQTGRLDV